MQIRPRGRRRGPGTRALLMALAGVLALGTGAGCAAGGPPVPPGSAAGGASDGARGTVPGAGSTTPSATAVPSTSPADPAGGTFTVVGDSITSGHGAVRDGSAPGNGSWVPAADGELLVFAGGWAVPGATTTDMAVAAQAARADVLVVLAGTNDLTAGLDWSVSESNLRTIVSTVGVSDVLLSTIPPKDAQPQQAVAFNEQLRRLADAEGWSFTDPWTGIDQAGSWAPGTSQDGVHPTQAVAELVGGRLRAALLAGSGA